MKLTGFQITKYRNIIDSGWVDVGDIAALIGQNECGKSNLLQALAKLNSFDGHKFNMTEDWPIDLWAERDDETVVCTARFELTPKNILALRATAQPPVTPKEGEAPAPEVAWPDKLRLTVTRDYKNQHTFAFAPELPAGHDAAKAREWATKNLPRCVYMDDYLVFSGAHPDLPGLAKRKAEKQKLTPEEETIMIALELAAIDLPDLVRKQGSEQTQRAYDTNAASRHLSSQFKNRWNQKAVKFDIRVDGPHLNIFVEDTGLEAFVPMEARSRGFQWYVSFVWRFTHASKGQYKNCILLLDEPGVHLHHAGHEDLLRFLEILAETNTVIYTTHLATMINLAFPERIRIMEVHDHHASVLQRMVSSQDKPMMVIEAALNLAGGMSGLLGNRQNLIVEGGQDAVILHKLSGVLRNSGEEGLSDRVYLLPARGAPNTPTYAGFMVGNGWDAGVLLDTDGAGEDARKKIKELYLDGLSAEQESKFRVLMIGDAAGIKQNEAAIEDLFPPTFYIECVNDAYGTNITEGDLPKDGSDQVCKRVEAVLKQRGRVADTIDKTRVMGAIQKRFNGMKKKEDLPEGTAAKARKLIDRINAAFAAKD
jgi:energy-coupling factor transporter ATP-binding protein EcfA2